MGDLYDAAPAQDYVDLDEPVTMLFEEP